MGSWILSTRRRRQKSDNRVNSPGKSPSLAPRAEPAMVERGNGVCLFRRRTGRTAWADDSYCAWEERKQPSQFL